ncbi:MAG: hypothetical protein ABL907_26270 [Hyphomicrobium sp.]
MLSMDEAKRIMAVGLGRAELEFVTSLTTPLYWVIPAIDGAGLVARNGSAFFIDTGAAVFGVTAAHVIRGMQTACAEGGPISCQIGVFDLTDPGCLIAIDDDIDIATFRISANEVRALGKTVLTGHQKCWPPSPPQPERGVTYSGFPGVSTVWLGRREISFGVCTAAGVASSVSDTDVGSMIERQHLMDVMGTGFPPNNFNFGGMSGGPMLTVIEQRGLRSWQLPRQADVVGDVFCIAEHEETDFCLWDLATLCSAPDEANALPQLARR